MKESHRLYKGLPGLRHGEESKGTGGGGTIRRYGERSGVMLRGKRKKILLLSRRKKKRAWFGKSFPLN